MAAEEETGHWGPRAEKNSKVRAAGMLGRVGGEMPNWADQGQIWPRRRLGVLFSFVYSPILFSVLNFKFVNFQIQISVLNFQILITT